jgi:hypothetical protein
LAADEAFFPKAILTGFGKCAIVRFLFAADAAFFMFFLAAFLCLVDAIIYTILFSSTAMNSEDIPSRICAALSATVRTPA